MSDVRLTINGIDHIVSGLVQEEPVADAVAALQLILLAFVAELRDGGVLDPQMLAHRLKGVFPDDAEDSTVKRLVEVFGRRLEDPDKPQETPARATGAVASLSEDSDAAAGPTSQLPAYRLTNWDGHGGS